jgi:site-specific DNA-methyltransferase (adenine-specific)
MEGYEEITTNFQGRFTKQTIELVKGLRNVLSEGSLLAYLVSMTLRITEIHRVLKQTGSFYLHCDPTASHYLKLVLDGIFCPNGGEFRNEIVWHYKKWSIRQRQFVRNHDIIFFYSKSESKSRIFNQLFMERAGSTLKRFGKSKIISGHDEHGERLPSKTDLKESEGVPMDDVWEIGRVAPIKQLFPTQKPDDLLERIIKASSDEGDVILDAYCGCGTTIIVAEKFKRQWIGIDITYQSISLVLKRLEDGFGKEMLDDIVLDGIPQDIESAVELANKKDDRLRKEFEKWAILTYSNNRAAVNMKKGADKGIDGTAYFVVSSTDTGKIVFQVKSGHVNRSTIATLRGDMDREKAEMAILITLDKSTKPMNEEAKTAGSYEHKLMGRNYDKIQIVTVKEIVEEYKRLEMPLSLDAVKKAEQKRFSEQQQLFE